jgi:hypothetical protein
MSKQFSLSDVMSGTHQLSDEQKQAFVELVGYRCHERTKRRLLIFISWLGDFDNHGIYSRVMFEEGKPECHYVAEQSYPDEIRTIRKLACK